MRLIDADALTMLLHDDIDGLDEEFPNDKQVKPYMCGVRMALSFIDTAPTVDAVPVVRCENCKFGDWYDSASGECLCYCTEHGSSGHNENDYCSYGEREDDEDWR